MPDAAMPFYQSQRIPLNLKQISEYFPTYVRSGRVWIDYVVTVKRAAGGQNAPTGGNQDISGREPRGIPHSSPYVGKYPTFYSKNNCLGCNVGGGVLRSILSACRPCAWAALCMAASSMSAFDMGTRKLS